MSSYKVAQDVEADDKLLGPFSFRQFIYLIIVALAGGLAYVLGKLLLPLAIIPLPFILFFGALALPLRKDQPMETYIAALISFYLKPHKRLWKPDGIQSLVEITVPRTPEFSRTKDLSENEAERRLSYLADIADTRGWSIRNVNTPQVNTAMQADVYNDSINTVDVLDTNSQAARSFESMIDAADQKRRNDIINRMKATPTVVTTPVVAQQAPVNAPVAAPTQPINVTVPSADDKNLDDIKVEYDPYPDSMQQSVIRPLSDQPETKPAAKAVVASPTAKPQPTANPVPPSTSAKATNPDIINLANNQDLSIETIAREAGRIEKKQVKADDGEVVISLR